jgi:hypothetical protein
MLDRLKDYEHSKFYGSETNKNLECNLTKSIFPYKPDIEEVNYISDGKNLHITLWLSDPFDYEKILFNETMTPNKTDNFMNETNQITLSIKKIKDNLSYNDYTQNKIFSLTKLPLFKKIDESNTSLFNLTGHQIIYSYEKNSIPLKAMKVWALANNTEYVFTYRADATIFEGLLPLIQKIKDSSMNISFINNREEHLIEGFSYYDNHNVSIQYPKEWNLEVQRDTGFISIVPSQSNELFFKTDRKIILSFDINSSYDVRGEDYRIYYEYDPLLNKWKRSVVSMKSSQEGITLLEEKLLENKTTVDILKQGKSYTDLYVNLSQFNFPDKYSVIPFVYDFYSNNKGNCMIDFYDFGTEVYFPPINDDFKFIFSPDNIVLSQGESKDIELQIKNNNLKINSTINLSSSPAYIDQENYTGTMEYVHSKFTPTKIYVSPDSISTSTFNIQVLDNASIRPYTLSAKAELSIFGPLRRMIENAETPPTGININKTFPVTVTVTPKITFEEKLIQFTKDIFDPLVGIAVSIIAIITAIVGIFKWNKKRKNK